MKKTLIFGAIVAALVAFTLFDYKSAQKEKGLGEHEQKLLTLTEGEVVAVDLRSKKEKIQLKSSDGVWHMIEPFKDDADDVAVVGLLNAIKDAKGEAVSDQKAHDVDWSKYGLNPGVEVEIATAQGQHDKFQISDTNAYDGSFYVRKGDQLLVGDRGLARLADTEAKNLRSHLIWRTKADVTQAEVQYSYMGEARHAILTKGEKGWAVEPKYDLPLSQESVKDWLQAIRDVRAADVMADAKSIEDFGLKKPSMKMTFNKDIVLSFGGEKKNDIYATNSQVPVIFKFSKFGLRDVRLPIERLLDGSQALVFPLEQAHEVEVLADGKSKKFVKGDKAWDKLADFFQKLKGLEPIADEQPSGTVMDPKKNHLTIKGSSGVLLDLTWSDVKDQLRWLKISNFKERFKVSAERFTALMKATE